MAAAQVRVSCGTAISREMLGCYGPFTCRAQSDARAQCVKYPVSACKRKPLGAMERMGIVGTAALILRNTAVSLEIVVGCVICRRNGRRAALPKNNDRRRAFG